MTLTREARKAETREAILGAARRLFAEQGVEATSLDRIASEVGLTKGAVYSTFANKEQLVEDVATSTAVSLQFSGEQLFDESIPLKEGLRQLAAEIWDAAEHLAQDVVKLQLEFYLYEQRHPDWGRRVRQENYAGLEEARALLEAAMKARGETLPIPIMEFVHAINSLGLGIVHQLDRDPKSFTRESVMTLFENLAG